MSSSCSSTDLGIDTDFDDILSESLIADIELFVEHVHRLRKALDANALATDECDCETKCVQVHAALSMVSQAVRDLLVKHPNFQTSNVFIPASQLVHSVKGINFDTAKFDASQSLQAIERLEAAIGNALRRSVNQLIFAATEPQRPKQQLRQQKKQQSLTGTVQETTKNSSSTTTTATTTTISDYIEDGNNLLGGAAPPTYDGLSAATVQLLNGSISAAPRSALMPCASSSATSAASSSVSDLPSAAGTKFGKVSSLYASSTSADSGASGSGMARRASGGHRNALSVSNTTPLATKQPHPNLQNGNAAPRLVRRHSAYQTSAHKVTANGVSDTEVSSNNGNGANLARRRDAEETAAAAAQMREILGAHENGMELAFERCKAWSKYASHLLMFVRARLVLEQEHVRSAHKLAEQTKSTLLSDAANNYLPLTSLFEELMDGTSQFAARATQTVASLNQRFITTFENRQKEHDARRRKLKSMWTKQKKQYDSCAEELRRARQILNNKEGGYMKARDSALRHELQVAMQPSAVQSPGVESPAPGMAPSTGTQPANQFQQILSLTMSNSSCGAVGSGASSNSGALTGDVQHKKLRELEKKRKNEEDALIRKTDAENEVWRLERELESRRAALTHLRLEVIGELCDLIRQCDLTTIACASHYFKAFSELWAPVPEEFNRLAAYAIRESSPSTEYMSFLQSQQQQQQKQCVQVPPASDASPIRSAPANCVIQRPKDNCTIGTGERNLPYSTSAPSTAAIAAGASSPFCYGRQLAATSAATNSGIDRPRFIAQTSADAYGNASAASRRRNALNADEHYGLIAETTAQQRRQKKSVSRLFEQSSSTSSIEAASEAAKSHQLQRTRQVTKCAYCEHLVIFDALKCSACGIVWHKKCLSAVTVTCGPSARRLTEEASAQRRMSIFGVPLKGHLDAQHRRIPLILERCVDELQQRGMTCKGLYRTCGVKSKIEQICALFEQAEPESPLELTGVHPMNLASVIKLYLRRLPEPLMTYGLYEDWLHFPANCSKDMTIVQLRDLVSRLPPPNYETLKFLILHLKRVTWFELENLMTASNLAAVISPSLIWARESPPASSAMSSSAAHKISMRSKTQSASSATSAGLPLNSSSTSFINDAHQQARAVELMVQNAYDVFLVERSTDWDEFFENYPDVERPQVIEDAETEACIAKKADEELRTRRSTSRGVNDDEDDIEDEEDDVDEDLDDNDDEGVADYRLHVSREVYRRSPSAPAANAFSSSTTSSMPSKRPPSVTVSADTASQPIFDTNGIVPDSSGISSVVLEIKCLKNGAALPPTVGGPQYDTTRSANAPHGRLPAKSGNGKQRSFTTSILVSPQADRKFAAILASRKQNSADYDADQGSRNSSEDNDAPNSDNRRAAAPALLLASRKWSETARSYQRLTQYDSSDTDASTEQQRRTLCSGEVVVDIKKEQYCLPHYNPNRASRTGKSGVPLSSASFNVVSSTVDTPLTTNNVEETETTSEGVDMPNESSPRSKTSAPSSLMFSTKVASTITRDNSDDDDRKLSIESQDSRGRVETAITRRKRLERVTAHQFNASVSQARAFSPTGNYIYAGDDDNDGDSKATLSTTRAPLPSQVYQPSPESRRRDPSVSEWLQPRQSSHLSELPCGVPPSHNYHRVQHEMNEPTATTTPGRMRVDPRLQSAVGVLFSGSDVSYV